jgi:hypothetical protein
MRLLFATFIREKLSKSRAKNGVKFGPIGGLRRSKSNRINGT